MTTARRIRRIQRWQRAPKQFVVDRVVLLACFVHHNPWRREDGAKHTRLRERCVTADSLMVAELAWLCEFAMPKQVFSRRVAPPPTCATCESFRTKEWPSKRVEAWCEHEVGQREVPVDGSGYCHLHSEVTK